MRTKLGLASITLAAALWLGCSGHRILIERPTEVGQQVRLNTVAMERQTLVKSIDGQVVEQGEAVRRVSLMALVTPLETNAAGQVTKERYVVERATLQVDEGVTKMILPPGEELVVTRGAESPLTAASGQPLSEPIAQVLKIVIPTVEPTSVQEEIFGIESRQQVGATWPLNAERLSLFLSQQGMDVEPQHIHGETKLVRESVVREVPCYELEAHFVAENVSLTGMPAHIHNAQGRLEGRNTGHFPVDGSFGPLDKTMQLAHLFRFRGTEEDGTAFTMERLDEHAQQSQYILVDAD